MKKFLIILILGIGTIVIACSDGGTGDRTHDLQTPVESTNEPAGNNVVDTTPTTNNNIYNPDSAAGQGTTYDSTSGGGKQ